MTKRPVTLAVAMAFAASVALSGCDRTSSLTEQEHIQRAKDYEDKGDLRSSIVELKRTGSGGHLLISLDSTSLPVFVPARSGAEELAGALKRGDRIEVKGTVREYQGREEIEVSRSSDVGRMN